MPLPTESPAPAGWLGRMVDVRPGEGRSMLWSAAYFFCLLYAYGILRPVRESLGLSGGAGNLPWLFSGTMLAMLAVQPAFAALVTRLPRKRFIPIVYRVTLLVNLGFWVLLSSLPEDHGPAAGYAFYVWISVFNLFVVSVFWGFMADVWRLDQAKRLFGLIGVGGTLGFIAGAESTAHVAREVGTVNCLLVSVVFLEIAAQCVRRLVRIHRIDDDAPAAVPAPQRDVWRGVRLVAREPYLRTISAYVLLYTLVGSFLYFQQGHLVERTLASRDERTALFARIDVLSQTATLLIQVFATGRLIRAFGITFALVSQPVIATVGWTALALAILFAPELAASGRSAFGLPAELVVLIAVTVLLRASNFATAKPAREALFTVVEREVKYKSKSFIDTLLYRCGDAAGGWAFKGLQALAIGLTGIAFVPVPLAVLWIAVGARLGRQQRALAAEMEPRPRPRE